MKVLFLNHKIINCGVYQYGKRLYEILKKTQNVEYIYKEIDCLEEYVDVLNENKMIKCIIYNYHGSTMSWLNDENIQNKVKNIGIPHESSYHLFDIICDIDPGVKEDINHYSLPRPIYENVDEMLENYEIKNESIKDFITKYTDTNNIIFGSFGFGFENKGFDRIVKMVNEQYDNAIIKLVIPIAHFDSNPFTTKTMSEMCTNIPLKEGIKLMIIHEFFSNEEILLFLRSNTMNLFLYDRMEGRGISSAIDYAISVKKPLGISNSWMFRNIFDYKICVYNYPIQNCMNVSIDFCKNFLNQYSHENTIDKFIKIYNDHLIFVEKNVIQKKIKLEVSVGESIDKLSILEIKSKKIQDPSKLQEIQKEIDLLNECNEYKNNFPFFYHLLNYVNEEIWKMTDIVKTLNVEEDPLLFSKTANEIFKFNQKRFRIKNWFNIISNSSIKEQKSYANEGVKVFIEDAEDFYDKIAEIHYLTLEYDSLIVYTKDTIITTMKRIIQMPNIEYIEYNEYNNKTSMIFSSTETKVLNLKDFFVENISTDIFDLPPLRYLCGGKFGDFIHSISIINERFYRTGEKGILYIVNGYNSTNYDIEINGKKNIRGDSFTNGVENSYNDTYKVIMSQRYIKDYQLYNNQVFDINLNIWRLNNKLHSQNWYYSYKETYDLNWGLHQWLHVPKDEKWKNTIVINTVDHRWNERNYNWEEILTKYNPNNYTLCFVADNKKHYDLFADKTGLNIEFYLISDFSDLCTIINSCHLFIAFLSSPLAIGCAFHKNIICLGGHRNFYKGLDKMWNHFVYI